MSTQASSTENGIDCKQLIEEADPKTIKRAEWEAFEFEMKAPGIVRVINGSHKNPEDHSYLVNVENGVPVACECPDFEYDNGPCKHTVAVAIREPVIEAATRPVMAEGGVTETNEDDSYDGRQKALTANEIACELTDIDGAGEDFDAFCAVVQSIQDQILESWEREERRQTERTIARRRASQRVVQ